MRQEHFPVPSEDPEINNLSEGKDAEFRPHELIVADSDLERSENVLRNNSFEVKYRSLRPKQVLDTKEGTVVPGEYVIEILDRRNASAPADRTVIENAIGVLRDQNIPVRKARNGTNDR